MVLGAVIWHYWIGVALMLVVIPLVLATIVGYLKKVVEPRYPKR
jgi:hypothetical protein